MFKLLNFYQCNYFLWNHNISLCCKFQHILYLQGLANMQLDIQIHRNSIDIIINSNIHHILAFNFSYIIELIHNFQKCWHWLILKLICLNYYNFNKKHKYINSYHYFLIIIILANFSILKHNYNQFIQCVEVYFQYSINNLQVQNYLIMKNDTLKNRGPFHYYLMEYNYNLKYQFKMEYLQTNQDFFKRRPSNQVHLINTHCKQHMLHSQKQILIFQDKHRLKYQK